VPLSTAAAVLPRRERNKQAKRDRIVAAGRALFSRKGFAATTTAEIAARAGIGTGTLFLYFATKEDLLVAIFREEMDAVLRRALDTLPKRASLLDELMHVYGAMIAFHERDLEFARAFVKEMMFAASRASVFEFIDRLDAEIAQRIALRQQRGVLDPGVPALLVAENCFALYIARLQKWVGPGGRLASAEHLTKLRDAFALQLRAVAPSSPGSSSRAPRPARRARRV
jgi:AcrR family transcriptional regulator